MPVGVGRETGVEGLGVVGVGRGFVAELDDLGAGAGVMGVTTNDSTSTVELYSPLIHTGLASREYVPCSSNTKTSSV